MTWLLDSNACICHLNGRNSAFTSRMNSIPINQIKVCSIIKAELFFGILRSQHPERNLARLSVFLDPLESLPFDDDATMHAARIRADLYSIGRPVGPHDILIAAIAMANHATIVTHNTSEFSRISGLKLEDWES